MTSANALYVLRLVWGGSSSSAARTSRQFSSAVLRAADSSTTVQTSTWATSTEPATATSSASTPDAAEFLESDESEYATASTFLPSRTHAAPPIPWPTLFTPPAQTKPHTPRPCDLVARLVAENRLEPARKVCNELTALHTRIAPRKLYLGAALTSLAPTETGKADFLFWMALYPNRPATRTYPDLKAEWYPLVSALLRDFMDDTEFIADVLVLAGNKGMLPTLLPPLLTPLVTVAPPEVSERIVESTITAYRASTTSATSTTARARHHADFVDKQIAHWWNMYLRAVALAGWTESARALLFSPPEGVRWTRTTRTFALQQGLNRREKAVEAAQAREAAERADPALALRQPAPLSLPKRIRAALSTQQLPHVSDLARVQADLLALKRHSLLAGFKRRFLRASPSTSTSTKSSVPSVAVKSAWWAHAEIMRLVANDKHAEAIARFEEHFLWIGLPHPNHLPPDPEASHRTRRIPSIQVITTLVPAIMALEGNPAAYHVKYLQATRNISPSLRPTAYTHLAFVRALGNSTKGPEEMASRAVETIIAAGYDPGLPSWNAVLLALQVRGQVDAVLRLLGSLERGVPAGNVDGDGEPTIRLPRPNARTYLGLIQTAARTGHQDQAAMYLKRFQRFIALNRAGKEVSGEDRALLGIAKRVAGKGKETARQGEREVEVEREVVEERTAATGI